MQWILTFGNEFSTKCTISNLFIFKLFYKICIAELEEKFEMNDKQISFRNIAKNRVQIESKEKYIFYYVSFPQYLHD